MRVILFMVCAALTGCTSSPDLHGNDRGGMIEWFGTNEKEVFAAATGHCAKYKKTARITDIQAKAGGHVLFECS